MFNIFTRFLFSGQGDNSIGSLDPGDRLSIFVLPKFHEPPMIGEQKETYLAGRKNSFNTDFRASFNRHIHMRFWA
jgi:hypothetical protein